MASQTDLWIKVPNPFWGVETVGFSVRYGAADGPPGDVPFFVEGDARLMAPLGEQLRRFPGRESIVDCTVAGEAYSWTDPISLSDEVIVMAFRDRSLSDAAADPVRAYRNRLLNQMVPLAFPFLRDCVRVAGLRLSSVISVRIGSQDIPEIQLSLPVQDIVPGNGSLCLQPL